MGDRALRLTALVLLVAVPAATAEVAPDGADRGEGRRRVRARLSAAVAVDLGRVLRVLPADLLGSNIQYPLLGDGLLDPATLTPWPQALAAVRRLGPQTVRFPGGGHSDLYHWRDGVGPQAERPRGTDIFTGLPVGNEYGSDEHMAVCAAVGAAPTVTANFGTGSPREAANWVEYLNAPVPQAPDPSWSRGGFTGDAAAPPGYFAWLRAQHGHPEPYGVARWEVGNEVYNDWTERYDAAAYAERFVEYCRAMKGVDPTIEVAAVGYERAGSPWRAGDAPWNRTVARIGGSCLDALHVHTYLPTVDDDSAVMVAEGQVAGALEVRSAGVYEVRVLAQGVNLLGAYPPADGQPARLALLVDGRRRAQIDLDRPVASVYRRTMWLDQGRHELAVAFTNDLYEPATRQGRDAVVGRRVEVEGPDALAVWLGEPATIDAALAAGPVQMGEEIASIHAILEEETGRAGLEVWVTEANVLYGVLGFGLDRAWEQRSAAAMAALVVEEAAAGVDLLQQWSLVADWYFGMLVDARGPALRSVGRLFPLLRRGLTGELVESVVSGPQTALGAQAGNVWARTAVPWLKAAATRSGARRSLLLVNQHPRAELAVGVSGLAEPGAPGTLTTVASAGCDTVDLGAEAADLTFLPGVAGSSLWVDAAQPLQLRSSGRVDPSEGALELWVSPGWAADDGFDHDLVRIGWTVRLVRLASGYLVVVIASETGDEAELDLLVADVRHWGEGEWHHVALTWREEGELRLYLDGELAAATPHRAVWTWVEPLIGLVVGSGVAEPGPGWQGRVDEVRLGRRELSAQEVASSCAAVRAGAAPVAGPSGAMLLRLDGDLADEVRDERTRTSVERVAGAEVATVVVPPCGVALLEVTPRIPAPATH